MSNEPTRPVIRVAVVDDHRIFIQGLELLFRDASDVQLVGTYPSAEEAIEGCAVAAPDVVLMDLNLPGIDGVAAIRELCGTAPDIAIVVLSGDTPTERVTAALRAGATGFVPKALAVESVLDAIRQASRAQATLPVTQLRELLPRTHLPDNTRGILELAAPLTARELEELHALCEGQTVRDIASDLHVSQYTIRGHVRGILAKLGAHSIHQAVVFSLQYGLT
jgi:DNA-binding NarL/FixJ family response regulator